MHTIPTPQDQPAPDADATGYTDAEHECGQSAVEAPGPCECDDTGFAFGPCILCGCLGSHAPRDDRRDHDRHPPRVV